MSKTMKSRLIILMRKFIVLLINNVILLNKYKDIFSFLLNQCWANYILAVINVYRGHFIINFVKIELKVKCYT